MQLDPNSLFDEIGLYDEMTFQKPQRVLTTLQIQVSEHEIWPLEVREFDDPYRIALEFCSKHQLNEIAVDVIEKRVQQIVGPRGRFDTSLNSDAFFPQNTKKKEKYNKSSADVGNRLYEKGLKSMQKAQETRARHKTEKEAYEQRELTFKPKINEVSEKIVEIRKMIGNDPSKPKYKNVKKVNQELTECTFKPVINKVSQKIVESRNGHNEEEMVEKLYYDSIRLAARKQKASKFQEYTYRPVINEKSRIQVRDTFMERLEKDLRTKKEKLMRSVAPEDYNCSFTPQIGRPPKITRNKQNLPIGDYLVSRAYQSRSKSQLSREAMSVAESVITNKNSEAIYQNLLRRRIEMLFQLMDGNKDGYISADHIDIQQLSTNTLLLLQPFFREVEEMNAVLDERMFVKAMLKLMEVSSQHLKGEFISERWRKTQTTHYPYRPKLNTKSAQLAQERLGCDLYDQGVKAKRNKQARTAILQAKKQQEELRKCTFRPMLSSTSQVYIKKALGFKFQREDSLQRFMSSSEEMPNY